MVIAPSPSAARPSTWPVPTAHYTGTPRVLWCPLSLYIPHSYDKSTSAICNIKHNTPAYQRHMLEIINYEQTFSHCLLFISIKLHILSSLYVGYLVDENKCLHYSQKNKSNISSYNHTNVNNIHNQTHLVPESVYIIHLILHNVQLAASVRLLNKAR